MQAAMEEVADEVSGVYEIASKERVSPVPGLHDWMPSLTRRGRLSGFFESVLVAAAVVGIMGLTSVLAVAHYNGAKSNQAAMQFAP